MEQQRGEALPEAQQHRICRQGLQCIQLRLQLRHGFFRNIGEQDAGHAGIDQEGYHQIGNHGEPEKDEHLRAAVADTVGDAGDRRCRLLLHQEFHGEEATGLLEDAGGQAAVNGVQERVARDDAAVGSLQHQLVHNAFQHQGEEEEGAGTDQDGGKLRMVLAHQVPRQGNGNGNADYRIDPHQNH